MVNRLELAINLRLYGRVVKRDPVRLESKTSKQVRSNGVRYIVNISETASPIPARGQRHTERGLAKWNETCGRFGKTEHSLSNTLGHSHS